MSKTVGDDIDRAETLRRHAEEEIRKLLHAMEQSPVVIMITNTAGNIEYVNPKFTQLTGYTKEEVIRKNPRILKSGETPPEEYKRLWDTVTSGGTWQGEFHNRKKCGKLFWESAAISPVRNAEGAITHFIAIKEDVTEIKRNEQRRKAQHAVTQILVESSTIEEASLKIIEVVCECLAWDVGELWLADKQKGVLCLAESWHSPTIELPGFEAITRKTTFAPGIGLPGRVWQSGKPVWVVDIAQDAGFSRAEIAAKEGLRGAFCFPVQGNREVIGVIDFLSCAIRHPDNDLLNMMTAIGRQIGLFIERKQSEEQTKIQLQRISALHEVDIAITGSIDLRVSLNIFLDKAVTLLKVDAADMLILDKHMLRLEYVAGRGFLSDVIKTLHVSLSICK